MYMELNKYEITAPPPHHVNLARINATKTEGHDPNVTEQTSSFFIDIYTSVDGYVKGFCTKETGGHNGVHGIDGNDLFSITMESG